MDKAALRSLVRARLSALPPAQRALEEELVTAAVQATPEWQAARTVLLYRSVAPEFSTVGLVNAAWREGKRTLFPVTTPEGLVLREAGAWTQFKPGALSIPEPTGTSASAAEVDLAVVPGVAFTKAGQRLGRGGGHYDRFLASLACPVWGVAFTVQMVADLPLEGHDRAVAHVWSADTV